MNAHTLRCVAGALALALPALGLTAELASLGGNNYRLHVNSMKEVRFKTTMRQQYDFSCGSAALATLLSYHYDFPVTEAQAFEEMYRVGDQQRIQREGFSLLDIKRFLGARGFAADGFELPLEKLVEAGFPAIVLLVENGYHHFVVVKGLQGDRVLIGDPSGGTRAMGRSRFNAAWQNHLLFVIHGTPRTPHFNAIADWRAAPQVLGADVIQRDSLLRVTLPTLGDGNF
jgi:predicted double-glycine peptidase